MHGKHVRPQNTMITITAVASSGNSPEQIDLLPGVEQQSQLHRSQK